MKRSIAYVLMAELKHIVAGVVSDVVASFVMIADQSGRRIQCLAIALVRQNDKGNTDFLGIQT